MNALETLEAARQMWLRQNDQLSLEVDDLTQDCTPEGIGGDADNPPVVAPGRTPVSPGCSTPSDPGGMGVPSGDTGAQRTGWVDTSLVGLCRVAGSETSLARTDGGPLPWYGRHVPGLEERRAEASNSTASTGLSAQTSAGGGSQEGS